MLIWPITVPAGNGLQAAARMLRLISVYSTLYHRDKNLILKGIMYADG